MANFHLYDLRAITTAKEGNKVICNAFINIWIHIYINISLIWLFGSLLLLLLLLSLCMIKRWNLYSWWIMRPSLELRRSRSGMRILFLLFLLFLLLLLVYVWKLQPSRRWLKRYERVTGRYLMASLKRGCSHSTQPTNSKSSTNYLYIYQSLEIFIYITWYIRTIVAHSSSSPSTSSISLLPLACLEGNYRNAVISLLYPLYIIDS